MDNRLGKESTAMRVFYVMLTLMGLLGFIAGALTVSIFSDSCGTYTVVSPDEEFLCGNKGCFSPNHGRSPDGDNHSPYGAQGDNAVVNSKVEKQL